ASGRHHGLVREYDLAYLAILVGAAGPAEQDTVALAVAKFLRRDETALPQPPTVVPCLRFRILEAACRGAVEIDRQALADQEFIEACAFAFDGASAEMPLSVGVIDSAVLAANLAAGDQAHQLIAGVNPARPCVGVIVDADLVDRGRIDAVEPV